MPVFRSLSPVTGLLLLLVCIAVLIREWGGDDILGLIPALLTVLLLISLTLQVRPGRQVFVAIGLGLTLILTLSQPEWQAITLKALATAGFIAAFFTALASLRSAAGSSASMARAGRFLAQQPPGRRYLALTLGGQLFALVLNYGSIALLGGLASAAAEEEPDPEIRGHRRRRMLLAIQRAFVSMLPWSPLSFAIAVSIALIPGAKWAEVVGPGIVTSLLMAGTGWALDTVFRPRLNRPRPALKPPEGNWGLMRPLLILLAVLAVAIVGLTWLTGIRIVGIVLLVVPLLAAGWVVLQRREDRTAPRLGQRCYRFFWEEMAGYRGELALLMMAGYIGTVGAPILTPLLLASGLDPLGLPVWAILLCIVWIIPALGQLGMNPILAVTLLAPMVPEAAAMGISPAAIIVAITAGWALSGASSPFTATTLLIGSFANISATRVGLIWNGAFTFSAGAVMSLWVLVHALWLGQG
ncbi:hypothetical protein ACM25N_11560 [Roseovarius sp. C7]|uniref:hypothetical protein n=1 Tax=Roseovarius sp. C7 TaxID=3398643 RepID=UPI0039F70849